VVQYVDDLLECSPSREACEQDSVVLLTALANKEHKASKDKLQFCQEEVKYLGHVLKGNTRQLSSERVATIVTLPKPTTIKQIKSFLGLTDYCREWIIGYAPSHPLLDINLPNGPDPLVWTAEVEEAFEAVKQALSAIALGLPPANPSICSPMKCMVLLRQF